MNSKSVFVVIVLFCAGFAFAPSLSAGETLPAYSGEAIVPGEWHVLGPFHSGSRESGTDPLFYFDGKRLPMPPDFRRTYPSIFGHGGRVGWSKFAPDENGNVAVKFENPPEADWEMREDEWGAAGVGFRGYAYTEVRFPSPCRALVAAQGIGSFQVNGRDYMGDAYGSGVWQAPAKFDAGVNSILVGLSGWAGSRSFTFKILPSPESPAGIIESDMLLPDLMQGAPLDSHAGIPIVNYTGEWQSGMKITIGGIEGIELTAADVPDVPPYGIVKLPVPVKTESRFFGKQYREEKVSVPVRLFREDFSLETEANIRVRSAGQTYRVTFLSEMDGSVQKYSVRPPVPFDEQKRYSMILSLHGAGVDSDGQVEAYGSYDWTYIVAPTNRRPYGFDWQDWGRLDALEVLERSLFDLPVNPDKVILSGHSMGGHGTWHVGSTHPDEFAAMIPIAGWSSFQLYVPFLLRQSEIFSPPEVSRILDMCNAPDRTELLVENLLNVPILAVHGTIDDNVPATHPRLLVGTLEKMGYRAKLLEQPEAGHWWDFNIERPGADAVDMKEIIDFAYGKERNAAPAEVAFVGYDLANENRRHWVTVLSQERLYGRTALYGKISGTEISLNTSNVAALLLNLPSSLWDETAKIIVDGQFVPVRAGKTGVYLTKTADGWNAGASAPELPRKFSEISGPIKRAYFSPFILVDATDGLEPAALECAVNEAARWWYRGNGFCKIKKYQDLTDDDKRNFNLVFYSTNRYLPKEIADKLPISIGSNAVRIGGKDLQGIDLLTKFVYPSPFNPEKLILINVAATESGLKTCEKLTALYSGSALPDFIIGSESGIARYGLAGSRAIGFFGANWEFDDSLSYIAPERK